MERLIKVDSVCLFACISPTLLIVVGTSGQEGPLLELSSLVFTVEQIFAMEHRLDLGQVKPDTFGCCFVYFLLQSLDANPVYTFHLYKHCLVEVELFLLCFLE